MQSMFMRFCCDENGATSIEYTLIGALISVFIISAATGVAEEVSTLFDTVNANMSTATSRPAAK